MGTLALQRDHILSSQAPVQKWVQVAPAEMPPCCTMRGMVALQAAVLLGRGGALAGEIPQPPWAVICGAQVLS